MVLCKFVLLAAVLMTAVTASPLKVPNKNKHTPVAALATSKPKISPIYQASMVPGKYFDRFFVIVLENTNYNVAAHLPYLSSLAKEYNGVQLTNYSAITHPSQPNYIGMIKGDTEGVFLDFDSTLNDTTIVDLLESKGISWKAYAENYEGGLNSTEDGGLYARKHVPFISFTTITNNPARMSKIVPATELDADIAQNTVPQFVFYTPNMKDDGHDTNSTYADNWLKGFLAPRINEAALWNNTAILITFDEQESYLSLQNHVFATLIGGSVKRSGLTDNTEYSHYSVLATVEDNWNLDNLGRNDAKATPFVLNG